MENKHIVRWSLPILTILFCGMAACSDSDGAFPDRERELQLRVFSEKLLNETSSTDPVFFAEGNEAGKYTEVLKAYVKQDGSVSLAEPKYYPSDNSRIYLCGFAPEGKPDGDGQIIYSLNGQQDIQVANEQSGSLTDMFWQEEKVFVFSHLLTKLRFRIQCDEAGKEKGWNLYGLMVGGVQGEAILSLTDKSVSFSGEKGTVTVLDRANGGECLPLDTDWVEVPEMSMIQPGVTVDLTMVLIDGQGDLTRFENLPISFDESDGYTVPGTSYLLSVTLRGEGSFEGTATVAPWRIGASGSGTVKE